LPKYTLLRTLKLVVAVIPTWTVPVPDVAKPVILSRNKLTNVPIIVDIAIKAKVVTISHLEDMVEKGALLGVCANPYLIGRLAGEKAAKILRGAKPSSIPIEPLKKFDLIINKKSLTVRRTIPRP